MHVGLATLTTSTEAEYLRRLLLITQQQAWIKKIVVLQTDDGPDACQSGNGIRFYKKHFGCGFDKQPEQGGFDEIGARNFLLELARKERFRWLLLADADEFFLPATEAAIRTADRTGCTVAWFSCHHLCDPDHYLWWPDTVRKIFQFQQPLHDPHPRAIRPTHFTYVINRRRQSDPTQRNRTMHCHLRQHASRHVHIVEAPCHFHLHHAIGPKRPGQDWLDSQQKVAVQLPDWVRQIISEPFRPA